MAVMAYHGYLFLWMWIPSTIISPEVFQYDSILIWQLDSILTLTGCSGYMKCSIVFKFTNITYYLTWLYFIMVIFEYVEFQRGSVFV